MLNKNQICIVIAEKDYLAIQNIVNKINDNSYLYELRADYLSEINKTIIYDIKKLFRHSIIFTLRLTRYGGKFINESRRQTLIQEAIDAGYEYVDIEVGSSLINSLDKKNSKYIISYHNYKLTPSYKDLRNIIKLADKNQADVIKIATQVNKIKDLQTLTKLLMMEKCKKKIIVIGMGDKGKMSRIFFPILGSALTYVASNNKLAPGQLTLKEIEKYV